MHRVAPRALALFLLLATPSPCAAKPTPAAADAVRPAHDFSSLSLRKPQSEEDDGQWSLFGRVDGSQRPEKLGMVKWYVFPEQHPSLVVELLHVEEPYRGYGLSTKILAKLNGRLRRQGVRPATITSQLEMSNKEALVRALVSSLRGAPGFSEPDPRDRLEDQFHACCARIYSRHPRAVARAFEATPAFKSHKQIGYTQIRARHFSYSSEARQFTIDMTMARQSSSRRPAVRAR